ncbi:MAG: hypothetical protein ACXWEV_03420 [Methylobacter sp.]
MNRIGDNLICAGLNKEIVKVFFAFDVEFILVGGLAISWYCSSRKADDMDILVNPTKENSEKITNARGKLGLTNFPSDCFAKPSVQAPIKQIYYCDIITPARNGLTFENLMKDSVLGRLFNITVHIPSIENLIKMKESAINSAGKELNKHQRDIGLLRKHAE